jgi:hypothetical protein
MIQPAALTRTFQDKESANAVLAMLQSDDLRPERSAHHQHPLDSTASITLARAIAKIADVGIGAGSAPLSSASVPHARADIAIEDWDVLFSAVTVRLGLIVAERLVTTADPRPEVEVNRVRVNVLECVAALDQLHATLTEELGQRPQL